MLEVPMVAGSVVQGAYYCGLILTGQLVKGRMEEGVYRRWEKVEVIWWRGYIKWRGMVNGGAYG
jgi:hypothetical protein